QMLFSDCYAVLALAAARTQRLRLGPGTAICGTRLPPVQVAAVATLNRLAPGRIHLGIGTGNTAMRAMGQKPMRIKDYAEYVRVLSALLHGDIVDYTYHGVTRPITMLMHEHKYLNLEPNIPLYVSGFGPRAALLRCHRIVFPTHEQFGRRDMRALGVSLVFWAGFLRSSRTFSKSFQV